MLQKMFALSNVTHRSTITEADYFITHITNKKNIKPRSYKMRHNCQVLVDLNKYVNKSINRLISTVGRYMKNTRAQPQEKQKITAVHFQKSVRCVKVIFSGFCHIFLTPVS